MRDMFGLTLLSLGIVPENATIDDVTAAQQKLLEANGRSQFRGYYGNEYFDALAAGDLIASVAWSGDVGQIALYENENVKFVIPERRRDALERQPGHPQGLDRADRRSAPAHRLLVRPRRGHPAVGVHRLLHRRRRGAGPDRAGRPGGTRRGRHRDGRPARDARPPGRSRPRTRWTTPTPTSSSPRRRRPSGTTSSRRSWAADGPRSRLSRAHPAAGCPMPCSARGVLWLLLFFAIPMGYMFIVSLQEGSLGAGYRADLELRDLPRGHRPVRRDLPPVHGLRADDHPDHLPDRLPDGLLHRLPRRAVQERSCSWSWSCPSSSASSSGP